MCKSELAELTEAVKVLSIKIDRLTQTMLPQEKEQIDLDTLSLKIQDQNLDPIEALTEAGYFAPKRPYKKR